jgi:hypothetical protein
MRFYAQATAEGSCNFITVADAMNYHFKGAEIGRRHAAVTRKPGCPKERLDLF